MKKLQMASWDIAEANQRMQQDLSAQYWAFLVSLINYDEVRFDQEQGRIEFAEYIPLTGLLEEVLQKIVQGKIAVTQCTVCQRYADMNKEEGIFGDSANLERFMCKACAQSVSAWDFYHQYLKIE